jgi:peptide/nickel transport system substrate-binding protein
MALAAVSAILASGLAACGGNDDDKSGGTGTGTGAATKFDEGSTAVVRPTDKKGGTLTFASSDDFDSTDPGVTYQAMGLNFVRLYSRSLLTYASKPGADGSTVVPDLADGLGEASSDAKTWTYKLKKGIKYEDGTEVKAKDVKYAIARTFDRTVNASGPSYFAQLLDAEGYKGPFKDKNLDNLKAIETPDDYTLVFKLKNPFAEFDYVAALPQSTPVPQAKDTGTEYAKHPMSTGPFMFQGNYERKKGGTLVPNPNWDAASDPNRKQLPAKITVTAGIKQEEIDARLIAGTLDVALEGTGVAADARAKIVADPKLKANADNPVAGFHWYFPINMKNVPNIDCRKAIIYAADRDAMWRAYGGEYGGEIASSINPPNISGRQPSTLYPAKIGYTGDVTKAKEALTACGKPTGFDTSLAFRSDRPKEKGAAEALAQSLKKVGINATLKGYPAGDYTTAQLGSPAFVKKENIGLGTYGWAADWPSGYGYLQPLTAGSAITDSGNPNPSELNDKEINDLWAKVVTITDKAEREKIYNQIDNRALELAAFLPNVYAKSLIYRPATVANVYFHTYYGMYDYANLGKVS